MSSLPEPRIGIIGGTGLYSLPGATVLQTLEVPTPFGTPSSDVTLVRLPSPADSGEGTVVAFLSRHGAGHGTAPQQINYRANLWAFKSLGVQAVVSSAAVGGLVTSHRTGSFAVPDQFLDRTWGRHDTFYDGTIAAGVQHLSAADPYNAALRGVMLGALETSGDDFTPTATVAVVNGPRFSTRAESAAMVHAGAHIISMTQYPEPVLAAELNMAFAALAFITDSDTGHDGSEPVTAETVFGRLAAAQPRILAVLSAAVETLAIAMSGPWSTENGGIPGAAAMPPDAVAAIMGAGQSERTGP